MNIGGLPHFTFIHKVRHALSVDLIEESTVRAELLLESGITMMVGDLEGER